MKRILCVEDNDDNQYMLHKRLTKAGFEVKIERNGAQVAKWAKTLLPDLIVMDLNLPGLNGWEATHQLKNQPQTKHIPIMVLSDHAAESSGEKESRRLRRLSYEAHRFERLVDRINPLLASGATPLS